ncbi:MAG: HD domain-containing protein, partial [Candidatus Nomurabacteria bacterium]|nr:HD domain-containing protein [Candidatus Nomurabacteria bacterium]
METLTKNLIEKVPEKVLNILTNLEKGGFEAYLVGGCVRDMIIGREPKDWDITTNATPEQIMPLFEKTIYENKFGTVGVCIPVTHETLEDDVNRETPKYDIIEVTPYRIEGLYSDKRHPDEVKFSQRIEDDLKRRDFTINALALNSKGQLVDLYEGIKDIQNKTIRTVGDTKERFNEDALRLIRAVRFSTELDFVISHETISAIVENSDLIKNISFERIRDEFSKIIMSKYPMTGIGMLSKLKLLQHIIPELEEGIHCEQKGEHIYDVFDHILHALGHAADKNEPLDIRLSALFHDIGKPRTRRWDGTKAGGKGKYTFYGHEVVGARMVKKIMERLKFPKDISEKVEKLVRYHMFFSDTETITLSAVRRVIVNVGKTNIWDLMKVRE